MPQVPYKPYPEGSPLVSGEQVDVRTTPEQFGANIGAAINHLGGTLDQAGNELWQRAVAMQRLNNENVARQASVAYGQEVAVAQADYDAMEGQAKHDALPGHLQRLEQTRLKYRSGLNPEAGNFFDSEAARIQNSFTIDAAKQASRALKETTVKSSLARIDLARNTLVDPHNETEWQAGIDAVTTEVNRMASTEGWSEDQRKDFLNNEIAKNWVKRIRQIGTTDTNTAFDMLEANKKAFGAHYEDAKEALQKQYDIQIGQQIGEDVRAWQAADPSRTTGEAEAHLKEVVDGAAHTSKSLGIHAMAVYRHQNLIADDVLRRDVMLAEHTVQQSILNHPDARTTNELFLLDPEAKAAAEKLEKMKPGFMVKLPAAIENAYKGRTAVANKQAMDRLWGMANSDSKELQQQFLEMDPSKFPEQVGDTFARQLMTKRQHMMERPAFSDPRIPDLVRYMNQNFYPTVSRLHLDAPPKRSDSQSRKNDYSQYTGMLLRLVDDYQQKNGKPPQGEDLKAIGSQVLYEIPGTGGWFSRDRPFYRLDTKLLDDIRSRAEAGGIHLSDDDVRRAAVQFTIEALRKKEGAAKSAPKPSASGRPEVPISENRPGSPLPKAKPPEIEE